MTIPVRNQTSFGWWTASFLMRFACDDEPTPAPSSTHRVWENTILIEADDRDVAYEKAIAVGRANEGPFGDGDGRAGALVFEGLTELLPVYEPLEDGSELSYSDYPAMTLAAIRSQVREKHQLDVFDDRDDVVDDDVRTKTKREAKTRDRTDGTRIRGGSFLCVDLDVSSPHPIESLVDELAPSMFALHVGRVASRHNARLELHESPDDLESGLRQLLEALGALEGASLEVLKEADVVLSIGVDADVLHETSVRVAPGLLVEAGKLGVAVEVVVYRPS